MALSRQLRVLKKEQCPWLSEASAGCHTQKLIDQDKALKNFFDKQAKYPRFKKRHQTQSVRYPLDQRHVAKHFGAESDLLKLPKLGTLKWSRPIESVPRRVTVSKDPCGRYFASMACEVEMTALPIRKNAIGVDVGIKDVLVTSEGFKSGAANTYRYARQLRMAWRPLSKRRKGSNRRRQQRYRVARIHARIKDSRRDFLHPISSKLINENQVVCLEDLNIKGMLRNRCLSCAGNLNINLSGMAVMFLSWTDSRRPAKPARRVDRIRRKCPSEFVSGSALIVGNTTIGISTRLKIF